MSKVQDRVKKLKDSFLSKEQALEKVVVFEDCEERLIKGTTEIVLDPKVDGQYVLSHQNTEYTVDDEGFVKLCRLVGIPSAYAQKMPAEYLFPHLTYWLRDGDVGAKAFIKGPTNGGRPKIAGFAKEDAFYYPLSKVFEQIDKVRPDYVVEGLQDVTWRDTTFGIVFPETEYLVEVGKKGDHLYGGIKVRASLLGEFPWKIAAFFMTLVCLNGMISRDEIYTFNRRLGLGGLDSWIPDGVTNASNALNAEIEKVRRLAEIQVTHDALPAYVSHMFDQMGTSMTTREAVLKKVVERNPQNLYDLMNAVTEVAHSIENRREVYTIQALGGFVASHAESCKVCHRPF